MHYRFVLLIAILFPWMSMAQLMQPDTLKSSYLIAGDLNGLDQEASKFSVPYLYYNSNTLDNSIIDLSKRFKTIEYKNNKLKFTALPHIGFYYAFGQQGVQDLKAEYHQKLSKKWLLNANILNEQFNGFQRNAAYNFLQYEAKSLYEDSLCTSLFHLISSKKEIDWNGGLETDTLLDDLPQDFIPVRKTNSTSVWNSSELGHKTKIFFAKENKSNAIMLENSINFRKYTFQESGDIAALYGSVYIDSLETNDSLRFFRNTNSVAFNHNSNALDVQLGISHFYYHSKAFDVSLDTNILRSYLDLKISNAYFNFIHSFYYEPFGNFNSWELRDEFAISKKIFDLKVGHSSMRIPLDFFYRLYNGNSLRYIHNISNLQKEDEVYIFGSAKTKKITLLTKAGYRFIGNSYQFKDSTWYYNAIPNFNILYFTIASKYESKRVSIQSKYQFNQVSQQFSFVPNHDIFIRFGLNVGLFKKKVLKSHIGADFRFLSAHKRVYFSPIPGTLDVHSMFNAENVSGYYTMAIFTNFNVNQFRFFARWDNIPYLWLNPRIEIVNGIYFPQTQVKVGFTWDFWN